MVEEKPVNNFTIYWIAGCATLGVWFGLENRPLTFQDIAIWPAVVVSDAVGFMREESARQARYRYFDDAPDRRPNPPPPATWRRWDQW